MDCPNRLVPALRAEWVELCAASWSNELVAGWTVTRPLFGGSVCALLEACEPQRPSGGPASRHDDVLLELLRIAAADRSGGAGRLAARVVMQRLLGWVTWQVSRDDRIHDRADREATVVTALVEAIHGYPVDRRPYTVVTNLRFDALRRINRAVACHQRLSGETEAGEALAGRAAPSDSDPLREAIEVLATAVIRQVIGREDAVLLSRRHLGEVPYRVLAVELGVSEAAVRQRAGRLLRRLSAA